MGLSSSLFSGVSGLNAYGSAMSVIGDNIANVNTIGYKSSRASFEDALSQTIAAAAGSSQIGRGVALSNITASFFQGSFESTSEPTDLAIGGKGFFMVENPNNENVYYTRAGQFRFDEEGFFVNPAGYHVQGWGVQESADGSINAIGAIGEIMISSTSSDPRPTELVQIAINLDATDEILATPGQATSAAAITTGFIFDTGVNDEIVFDDGAGPYTVSLITQGGLGAQTVCTGDEVATAIETALTSANGESYTVTYSAVTNRFTIVNDAGNANSIDLEWSNASSTAAGTLGFDTVDTPVALGESDVSDNSVSFNILAGVNDEFDITVDRNPITGGPVTVTLAAGQYTASELAAHMETAINQALIAAGEEVRADVSYNIDTQRFVIASASQGETSYIEIDPGAAADFLATINVTNNDENQGSGSFSVENADTTSNYSTTMPVYDSFGSVHPVYIYFRKDAENAGPPPTTDWQWFAVVGASDSASGEDEIQAQGTLTFNESGTLILESDVAYPLASGGFDFTGGAAQGQEIDIRFGLQTDAISASTQFSSPSSTIFQSQDGYGSGFLESISVDVDGVISGHYSNGQIIYLFKVALANFSNPWGLKKEGGNLYSETRKSGQAVTGPPGSAGLGRISPNSLEQSNVDLANEFVKMIITQRGFQANSKIITTTDEMLAELINLKR